jgi:hypothetical protein
MVVQRLLVGLYWFGQLLGSVKQTHLQRAAMERDGMFEVII